MSSTNGVPTLLKALLTEDNDEEGCKRQDDTAQEIRSAALLRDLMKGREGQGPKKTEGREVRDHRGCQGPFSGEGKERD